MTGCGGGGGSSARALAAPNTNAMPRPLAQHRFMTHPSPTSESADCSAQNDSEEYFGFNGVRGTVEFLREFS